MTSQLRDLDLETLQKLCLEQLEGMSKKRILHILAGKKNFRIEANAKALCYKTSANNRAHQQYL